MLMVAGLLEPTTGVVRVDGKALSGPMTDVGIVFQDHLLLDFRTAIDNVLLQGVIRKLPMAPVRERTHELFERLGLTARRPSAIRINCPAACASACRWRARWCCVRRCC